MFANSPPPPLPSPGVDDLVPGRLPGIIEAGRATPLRPAARVEGFEMDLEPGDVQLISNHTVLHARTAYQDHADPARRRHLLRLWLSFDEPLRLADRLRKKRALLGLAWAVARQPRAAAQAA